MCADVSHILQPPPIDDGVNQIRVITREELYETATKPIENLDGNLYMYNRPKLQFSFGNNMDNLRKIEAKQNLNPVRVMKPVGYYLDETPKINNEVNTEPIIRKPTAENPITKEFINANQQEIQVFQCECTQDFEGNVIVINTNHNHHDSKDSFINRSKIMNYSSDKIDHSLLDEKVQHKINTSGNNNQLLSHPYPDRDADRPRIPFNRENSKDQSKEELDPNRRLNSIPDYYPQKLEDFGEGYTYDRPKNPMRLPNGLR